ncbi:hypothetical protein PM082_016764 [Marasmius tenuissimus]|nr:hypothetical protein PM082_016764 [Marasmius tenuissimus]
MRGQACSGVAIHLSMSHLFICRCTEPFPQSFEDINQYGVSFLSHVLFEDYNVLDLLPDLDSFNILPSLSNRDLPRGGVAKFRPPQMSSVFPFAMLRYSDIRAISFAARKIRVSRGDIRSSRLVRMLGVDFILEGDTSKLASE